MLLAAFCAIMIACEVKVMMIYLLDTLVRSSISLEEKVRLIFDLSCQYHIQTLGSLVVLIIQFILDAVINILDYDANINKDTEGWRRWIPNLKLRTWLLLNRHVGPGCVERIRF